MKTDWRDIEGTVADVTWISTRGGNSYTVVFTYKVDGEWYGGTFHTNEAYRKNDAIAVRYDATKPEHNDLVDSEKRRKWITAAIVAAIAGVLIFVFLH